MIDRHEGRDNSGYKYKLLIGAVMRGKNVWVPVLYLVVLIINQELPIQMKENI